MHTTLLQVGKQTGQPQVVASASALLPSRLFHVIAHSNGLSFLVNTGAEVRLILPSATHRKHWWDCSTLQAIIDSPIVTYGIQLFTINIELQWTFQWIFIVAEVKHPIISADFLRHHNLLINMSHNHLTYALTHLQVRGVTTTVTSPSPTLLYTKPQRQIGSFVVSYFRSNTTHYHIYPY